MVRLRDWAKGHWAGSHALGCLIGWSAFVLLFLAMWFAVSAAFGWNFAANGIDRLQEVTGIHVAHYRIVDASIAAVLFVSAIAVDRSLSRLLVRRS